MRDAASMTDPTIDIRIFGVPERMTNILSLKSVLGVPDDRVVIDVEHAGCIPTAKRAWGIGTESDFVLVLQDDVELCDDFLAYCARIASAHPKAIIGFYPGYFPRVNHIRRRPPTPYISVDKISAPGIMMPSSYVGPCLGSWTDEDAATGRRGDDTNIQEWALTNGVTMLTTIPCIIQHIGFESVFDPGRNLGSSDFFAKDPFMEDWDSDYFTPWTNVVKR